MVESPNTDTTPGEFPVRSGLRSSGGPESRRHPAYDAAVASDDVDKALKAWRKAEEDYSEAAAPYMNSATAGWRLTKKVAIELSELRSRADSRMQRYFKHALK